MIRLEAKDARSARREASEKFPQGAKLTGYAGDVVVYLSLVRARGDKHGVATAVRNRSPKPSVFYAEPL